MIGLIEKWTTVQEVAAANNIPEEKVWGFVWAKNECEFAYPNKIRFLRQKDAVSMWKKVSKSDQ